MNANSKAISTGARLGLLCGLLLPLFSACTNLTQESDKGGVWEQDSVVESERARRQAQRAEIPAQGSASGTSAAESDPEPETRVTRGPGPARRVAMSNLEASEALPELAGEPIQVGYSNMPLPAFINTVFGEQLALPYSLDPALARTSDLVTLRLTAPVTPQELFRIARRTLVDYGVAMRQEEGVFVFYIDANVSKGDAPLIISGRALPDVPDSHRPVFMFVPLEVISPRDLRSWLMDSMKGREIQITASPPNNTIMLKGKPALVEQALGMVKLLDQPQMRGRHSMSIEPAFVNVENLATDLVEILKSEGYEASTKPPNGAVILLPLESNNQLVVFAASQAVLSHVEQWVHRIDKLQKESIKNGVFTYKVKNTQATYLVELLNQLEGPGGGGVTRTASDSSGAGTTIEVGRSRNRFVVDTNRNAIIFRGSGQEWAELLPVMLSMDETSPSVLIEVLLAEISLNDTESSSFEFLAKTGIGDYDAVFSTLDLLNSGNSAFRAVFNKRGETRAVLQLLYEERRAEIRSRPRLMAKSGQTASIDVGDEVPIVTQESQSVSDPGAPIVSSVVYRNTGVRLEIRPIVHNSGVVDVEVTQELSEAEVNETSGIDSPTIRNRTVRTTVTLQDGGSILLGGLISTTSSVVDKGVPVLGKVPVLGRLFSTTGEIVDRKELIMLITPYVLDTPQDSQDLTELLSADSLL